MPITTKCLALLLGAGSSLTWANPTTSGNGLPLTSNRLSKRTCPEVCTYDTRGLLQMDPNTFSPPGGCDKFSLVSDNTKANEVCVAMPCGTQFLVEFKEIPGYKYDPNNIAVWIGTSAPTIADYSTYPFTAANGYCRSSPDGRTAQCTIALDKFTQQTASSICPKEGEIGYYTITKANMLDATTGTDAGIAFANGACVDSSYPCVPFWSFSYKCGLCNPPTPSSSTTSSSSSTSSYTPSPTPKICSIGTAFGYAPGAPNFNGNPTPPALGLNTCNRWGWYFNPTSTTLSAGITGKLLVGAGGNDVNKATEVGTFTAKLSTNKISVTYTLYNSYDLSEVHIYASCSKPTTCAPGQYTYKLEGLTGTSDQNFSVDISVGACSNYYLIFHAKVNSAISSTNQCPTPVA